MMPWVFWHFKMGSRLTGQVKYMKMFLEDMHDLLNDVQLGRYNGEPFDEKSNSFNGREVFLLKNLRKRLPPVVNGEETAAAEPLRISTTAGEYELKYFQFIIHANSISKGQIFHAASCATMGLFVKV